MKTANALRLTSLLVITGAFAVTGILTPASAHSACNQPATITLAVAEELPTAGAVDAALRDLWIGHSFQVRNVVMATISGNRAEAEAAEKAVVANAQAIAAAVEPYYGADAKEALFKLLAGHYGGIKAYLQAAIAKDDGAESAAIEKITSNAEDIGLFLSGANPNLSKDDVVGLLQAHAGHHISQIQQLIAKDYAGELQTWGDMSQHMYVIADALAEAIAKQFPSKFKA